MHLRFPLCEFSAGSARFRTSARPVRRSAQELHSGVRHGESHLRAPDHPGRSSAAIRKSRVSVRMVTPYSFSRTEQRPPQRRRDVQRFATPALVDNRNGELPDPLGFQPFGCVLQQSHYSLAMMPTARESGKNRVGLFRQRGNRVFAVTPAFTGENGNRGRTEFRPNCRSDP